MTGATGLLGRHLVAALVESGTPVRALVRESSRTGDLERLGVEVQRGSLVDEAALERAVDGVDVVFHLGGVVTDDPSDASEALWNEIRRVNVDGTELLSRRAAARGVRRFVFCSSLRVFGFGSQLLWGEDDPRSESDLYARGKALAEEALLRVGAETGLEVVIVRPRFVYGDGDRYILPRLVRLVERGRVPLVGGRVVCDLVHVRDVVQALVLAAERPVAGEAFNVTSGECLTGEEILTEVARALAREVSFVRLPAPVALAAAGAAEVAARARRRRPRLSRAQVRWTLNDHHFSIAKARRELGYEPRYRLADGLRETDLGQFSRNGG